MSLTIGTRLGGYEIVGTLGAGGMGEVYRAHDSSLGRDVAIKVLPEALAQDPERLQRFEREARALATLNHPNIATVHGYDRDGDTAFLVMELVEGPTLGDRIARGAVPASEAIVLFRQIAEGLEAAHERGIIHRDLKPANIKIGGSEESPQVKILDFGLAKAVSPLEASGSVASMSESPTLTLAATMRGEILGTAAYMSPEQAAGKQVDKRTDIWAFGVCLFEALTGERTFRGEDAANTLAAVLRDPIDLSRLPADTPAPVRRVLDRCLERSLRDRLHDVADARIELGRQEEVEFQGVPVAAPARTTGWPLAVAGLVAGLLIAGGAAFWLGRSEPESEAGVGKAHFRLASGALRYQSAISPDGARLAYIESVPGTGALLKVRSLDSIEDLAVPDSTGASFPAWSPDSRAIAFFRSGQLMRFEIGRTAPTAITSASSGRGASWIDESEILFADAAPQPRLMVVPAAGGEPVEVLSGEDVGGAVLLHPHIVPGTDSYIVLAAPTVAMPGPGGRILLGDLSSRTTRHVVDSDHSAWVTHDGFLLYAKGRWTEAVLLAQRLDLESAKLVGVPVPLVGDIGVYDPVRITDVGTSENGVLVYRARFQNDASPLSLMSRDGSLLETLDGPGLNEWPRISPDGDLVVTASSGDLWVYDLDRGSRSRLTFEDTYDGNPMWSPDGRSVIFTTLTGERGSQIRRIRPSSPEEPEVLLTSEYSLIPCAVTRDGRSLIYTLSEVFGIRYSPESDARDEPSNILILDLESGESRGFLESSFVSMTATLSPDERLLAYASNRSGMNEVYLRDFPQGLQEWKISRQGGTQPRWNADGSELFYLTPEANVVSVPVSLEGDPSPGAGTRLFASEIQLFSNRDRADYDAFPDGQRFVALRGDAGARINVILGWAQDLVDD